MKNELTFEHLDGLIDELGRLDMQLYSLSSDDENYEEKKEQLEFRIDAFERLISIVAHKLKYHVVFGPRIAGRQYVELRQKKKGV